MIIEGWRFLDALYMTIITISTVGYREVNQVGDLGRIFTIIVVFTGVGFSLYVAGAVVQFMVEGRMRIILGRRRLDKKIDRLKKIITDYDDDWELIQIFTPRPKASHIQLLFRQKKRLVKKSKKEN